jgi:hypothetical protein
MRIRQRTGRIQVITARDFTAWLASLPRLFSPAVVDTLSGVALQSSTWPARPAVQSRDVHHQRDDFDRLLLQIASARLRRLIWTGLGVIASYAAVIVNSSGQSALELLSALGG